MKLSTLIIKLQREQERLKGCDTNGADMDPDVWVGGKRPIDVRYQSNNQLPPTIMVEVA